MTPILQIMTELQAANVEMANVCTEMLDHKDARILAIWRRVKAAGDIIDDLRKSESPALNRIIDLRGFSAPEGVYFVEEDRPARFSGAPVGTPHWTVAPLELRTVERSSVVGIAPGDQVLFSRVDPASVFQTSES